MIAVYDKLIYFNEASKYTILRMRTDDPSVPEEARSQYTFRDRLLRFTAVGYGLPQTDSVKLEIEGDWKEGKYGLQLHVEHWHELVPPTTEGLLSYLSSGLLKGIGESTAKSIVLRFGTDTLDVLEYHPEKLLEIRGITEQKLEEIKTCYAESRAMRDIMELLTPFQVTPVTAMKIYQHFGPACTDILRKSPFRLCEISGFGFRRVDTIIRKSGGDPHDPVRIHGAMICALENARQHGHLYLEVNALITESLQFLNEPIPLPQMQVRRAEVEQKLQQMAEDNEIVSDGGRLYLPHIFMQEVETAAKAAAMLMESTEKIDVTLPLEQVKQKLGLHLTKRQSRGVEVAMERNLSIITGGPGTGKTTVLKAIIEVYRILHPKNRIVLAAPTGKASRRMAQSTGMLEALTLHSLLGLQGDFCSKDKQDQPLQVDFLIVDEASMVDMWLAHQLFTRLQKDTKLLLLGDVDQLESVGAGNVFAELIGSGIVPVTVLDEIFRQSKDSLIAYNAKFINEENSSLFYGPDFQFVKAENQEEAAAQIQELYLRELQDTSIGQLQIISPYRVRKLLQRHDELAARGEEKQLTLRAGEILQTYPHIEQNLQAIREKFAFTGKQFQIQVPNKLEDIFMDSRKLCHCIANSDVYWERMERRESYLLFLRKTAEPDTPYYTVEAEPGGTVRQVRTQYNRQNDDIGEVRAFLKIWQKQLAADSHELRIKELVQLRNDQVTIHTGDLAGRLLVDVLTEDLMEAA